MQYLEGHFVYGDGVYVDDYYADEKWAYIKGFPNYMVSNKARVWSVKTQQFLKVKPMDNHGHLGVCLYQNSTRHYRYIHRLVAEAFIPNPNNYPVVRHIYDNPQYNEVEDLMWGTQQDNINDTIRNGRNYIITSADREKWHAIQRTPVRAINPETGESLVFISQCEAGRRLGIPQANIHKVLRGERPRAKGWKFEYVEKGGVANVVGY